MMVRKGGQVTKLIIVVKTYYVYKLLYVIQVVNRVFEKLLLGIKDFGRTYLFTMLLLIGLALFYTQDVFV